MSSHFRVVLAGLALIAGACVHPSARPTRIPIGSARDLSRYTSVVYRDPAHWLCLPGRTGDACRGDLTATEIRADGTRLVEPDAVAPSPHPSEIDCFYVYPTVDMNLLPGNHDDFRDTTPMTRATVVQAARFRGVCSLYVPLYRQVTIGTYLRTPAEQQAFLDVAFSDVADAFLHYMHAYNHGRRIVLLGHSQGAEMVIRLLHRFFDNDASMRERLVLAMAIGGDIDTPRGQRVGGTFAHLPLCAHPDETACVVAYHSFRRGDDVHAGRWAPPPGNTSACVNPARLDSDEPARFARTYFPLVPGDRSNAHGTTGVTTPFVVVREAYAGQCTEGAGGFRYLAISPPDAPGDTRASLLGFNDTRFGFWMGLHVLDYQFPQGDLIEMVRRRSRGASPAAD